MASGLELARVLPAPLVHQRRRQQLAVLVAAQQGLDLGRPHGREQIGPGPQARAVVVADGTPINTG